MVRYATEGPVGCEFTEGTDTFRSQEPPGRSSQDFRVVPEPNRKQDASGSIPGPSLP